MSTPRTLAGFRQSLSTRVRGSGDLEGLSPAARAMLDAIIAASVAPELNVVSGFRDAQRNAAAGGARGSRHMSGDAIDISTTGMTDAQRAALLEAAIGAGARGVGLYPSGAIHVDVRDTPAFWGVGGSHRGASVDQAPEWARPLLARLFEQGGAGAVLAQAATRPQRAPSPAVPSPASAMPAASPDLALATQASPAPTPRPERAAPSGLGAALAALAAPQPTAPVLTALPTPRPAPTRAPDLGAILAGTSAPLSRRA